MLTTNNIQPEDIVGHCKIMHRCTKDCRVTSRCVLHKSIDCVHCTLHHGTDYIKTPSKFECNKDGHNSLYYILSPRDI